MFCTIGRLLSGMCPFIVIHGGAHKRVLMPSSVKTPAHPSEHRQGHGAGLITSLNWRLMLIRVIMPKTMKMCDLNFLQDKKIHIT